MIRSNKTLNLKGTLYDLSYPRIMGILNVTPDSFYTASRVKDNLSGKAEQMVAEGVDIFDVGGYSTRPGAAEVSLAEELDRVIPVIEYLSKMYPHLPVSIDTFRADVAEAGVAAGAALINDVSGGNLDEQMFAKVASLEVPYILMHMRGTPSTMTSLSNYGDVLTEVLEELMLKFVELRKTGVKDIIIDPGFGFAKNAEQNFELLREFHQFNVFGCPLLAGVSRKKMIYESLSTQPEDSLNGTTVLNTFALSKGADILRVHDVKEAFEVRKLLIDKGLLD